MNKVAVVKVDSYDIQKIYYAVIDAINKINFKIPRNKTVLIKPNILAQNKPDQHSITHYSVIDAVCRIFKENNCNIQIGESISFYQKGLTRKAFVSSIIKEVAKKYNAELIAFDEEPLVKITDGIIGLKEFYLPEKLLKADIVIDMPKLKTHSGLRLTGAVKNMFGCIPGGLKQKAHIYVNNDFELSDIFLDICNIVQPKLSIMDAIISLDGGPSASGKPVKTGRILVSTNPVSLDVVAGKILGYKPEEISTLVRAKDRALINNFEDIRIIGDIPKVEFKKLIKGPIVLIKKKDDMFVTDTFVNPLIKFSKCNFCYKCLEFCPVDAIVKNNNYPLISIDYNKCINCYYCLSACPCNAIKTKSTWKNKFINIMRRILNI